METNPEPKRETNNPETNGEIPLNAIVVLEGVIVHVLREAVINIGRKLGNHIVIDDPRISRHHAQLRAVSGHFVLYDLNSTGGTFVNGQRTDEITLYPGDLISLAGVTMVYTQDATFLRSDQVETAPLGASELDQIAASARDQSTVNFKVSGGKAQKPGDTTAQKREAGKYAPLEKYLRELSASQSAVTLHFEQIESILNSKLPASAYEDRRWWDREKEGNHVNTRAWAKAGWKVASLDVNGKQVNFVRVDIVPL